MDEYQHLRESADAGWGGVVIYPPLTDTERGWGVPVTGSSYEDRRRYGEAIRGGRAIRHNAYLDMMAEPLTADYEAILTFTPNAEWVADRVGYMNADPNPA